MDRIRIRGGRRLSGDISISGAKNAALKLMAASLLTAEPLTLANVPRLADVRAMAELLRSFGVGVTISLGGALGVGDDMKLEAGHITSTFASYDMVRKMRASFQVLGPLLARIGEAKVSLPGGCAIGARPVELHLDALKAMGADVRLEDGYVVTQARGGLKGAHITFPFVSVGATETALTAATLAKGVTRLTNAAREPEVTDLCRCLVSMGAQIDGIGTGELVIEGVRQLHGASHKVMPDRIEAQIMALMTVAEGSSVVREKIFENRFMHVPELARMGAQVRIEGDTAFVKGVEKLKGAQVMATDLRASSSLVLAGLVADGETSVGRVYHLDRGFDRLEDKLTKAGADIARIPE